MSYGLIISNADGREQINSTETAPNTFISNVTTSSYNSMTFPVSNTSAGDLTLARPANSPIGTSTPIALARTSLSSNPTHFWGSSSNALYFYQNTAGIVTALLKTQAGNISAPSSGEHGMDVYSTNGSTILFSATRSTSVRVLAQGVLAANSEIDYTPPSSLTFTKIYAVVDSTVLFAFPAVFVFPDWTSNMSYSFHHGASTPFIRMNNRIQSQGQYITNYSAQFPYMLVYDTN